MNLKLRYLFVAVSLVVTATAVSALQHDSTRDIAAGFVRLEKIPMQIGEWQGYDLALDEKVYDILETRAIIHRNYKNDSGNIVLLSIVYYNDTRVDFHTPEGCLGGRGKKTTKTVKHLDLDVNGKSLSLEVAEIMSSGNDSNGLSYYFYKTGAFLGQNYIKMRLNLAKNSFMSGDKSGALIRFSGNYFFDDDKQKVDKEMRELMQEILPVIIANK